MTQPPTVRAVRPDDYPEWLTLWSGYNAFYGRSGPTAVPEETTRTSWARFFDADEPMHAFVAEIEEAEGERRLLGLAHCLFHRSTNHLAPLCYLQDLFTAEAARGQGVGRALIQAVYDFAAAAGSPRVYWMTHESNDVAMKLYDRMAEKSGFLVYRKPL